MRRVLGPPPSSSNWDECKRGQEWFAESSAFGHWAAGEAAAVETLRRIRPLRAGAASPMPRLLQLHRWRHRQKKSRVALFRFRSLQQKRGLEERDQR
jgi:hypothetical protein